jgi:hypothetical protein
MIQKTTKNQSAKFIATARGADCDESEVAFDGKLKRIAKAKTVKKAGKK